MPPNTITDPPDPALPEPPTRHTDPPVVHTGPTEISNRPPSDYKKDTPIDLAVHLNFILEPPHTSYISAMPVLHEPPDTILIPPAISDPDLEPSNTITYPP